MGPFQIFQNIFTFSDFSFNTASHGICFMSVARSAAEISNNMVIWKFGNMEIWKFGNMEISTASEYFADLKNYFCNRCIFACRLQFLLLEIYRISSNNPTCPISISTPIFSVRLLEGVRLFEGVRLLFQ